MTLNYFHMLSTHKGCEKKRWDDSTHSGSCVGGAVTEVSGREKNPKQNTDTLIQHGTGFTHGRIPDKRVAV